MRHPTLVVNVLLVKVTNPFPRAVHRPGDPVGRLCKLLHGQSIAPPADIRGRFPTLGMKKLKLPDQSS